MQILSLFFLYYVFFNKKNTLTIAEKQWIDNNKTNVIDISVLNDVPAFTYNGNGVIFDFLNYVSKSTNLSFNPSAFRVGDTDLNNYSFTIITPAYNTAKYIENNIKAVINLKYDLSLDGQHQSNCHIFLRLVLNNDTIDQA